MSVKMGAVLIDDQQAYQFSVWAPHADEVYVTGSFNNWQGQSHPLTRNENGIWSAIIPEAKEGDEYKYHLICQGREIMRNDPYARNVTSSVGNSVISRPPQKRPTAFKAPDLNNMVIYELHIGTFGHGYADNQEPATFKTSIRYLDDLKALGVNAIEIMPVHEFPGGISWGYNPAHLFSVESNYGTIQDFYDFIYEAHQRGIAVILDVVYNHFGPSDLDIWQFDGWHENNLGGIYFYNDWRAKTPWGDTRPDYGRSEVRQYILDNVMMWAEDFEVDGLRLDMSVYIRTVNGMGSDPHDGLADGWSLMQAINNEVHAYNPRFITIAEDMQDSAWLTNKSIEEGGAGFNAQWGAFFVHTLRDALLQPDDINRDMSKLAAAISQCFNHDVFERVIYTESHDEIANGQARIPEDASPGHADSWIAKKKSLLGAGIVFTTPGIPMLFQGQEFLEDHWFEDTRELDRQKAKNNHGILQAYKDLISLRLNKQAITAGLCGQNVQVYSLDHNNKVIAYHRWINGGEGDSVVIIANFSHEDFANYQVGFPAEGEWHIRFNSNSNIYDDSFNNLGNSVVIAQPEPLDDQPASGTVILSAYSLIILSRE